MITIDWDRKDCEIEGEAVDIKSFGLNPFTFRSYSVSFKEALAQGSAAQGRGLGCRHKSVKCQGIDCSSLSVQKGLDSVQTKHSYCTC